MFWSNAMKDYNTALKELDKGNFCSMSYHRSHDRKLLALGLVRVLEIQAENGWYHLAIYIRKIITNIDLCSSELVFHRTDLKNLWLISW